MPNTTWIESSHFILWLTYDKSVEHFRSFTGFHHQSVYFDKFFQITYTWPATNLYITSYRLTCVSCRYEWDVSVQVTCSWIDRGSGNGAESTKQLVDFVLAEVLWSVKWKILISKNVIEVYIRIKSNNTTFESILRYDWTLLILAVEPFFKWVLIDEIRLRHVIC